MGEGEQYGRAKGIRRLGVTVPPLDPAAGVLCVGEWVVVSVCGCRCVSLQERPTQPHCEQRPNNVYTVREL
jgi:hypothetical protein